MQKDRLSKYGVKFGSILAILYIIFLLGKSLWTNYSLKVAIQKLNDQIASLEQDKTDLNNLIIYYNSNSFKELEARRRLGLKFADEKVFIISQNSPPLNFEEELKNQKEKISSEEENKKSNWQLWLDYFFQANS